MLRFHAVLKSLMIVLGLFISIPAFAQSFSDVTANHPNAAAILYVQGHGIVSGYSDGTYRPGVAINRGEFTKIVMGAYGAALVSSCNTSSLRFSDTDDAAWYAPYLCAAAKRGIIAGYPDGTFKPSSDINFAEAAKIIASAADRGGMAETAPTGQPWYQPYVRYLSENNASAGIVSPDHLLTCGEMAEIIYRLAIKTPGSASAEQSGGEDIQSGDQSGGKDSGSVLDGNDLPKIPH